MIGLNENIELVHEYSKIEFCYNRLAIQHFKDRTCEEKYRVSKFCDENPGMK